MSIYVSTRVWDHSKASGANLLMLLALADRSDEQGVSWPGIAFLAEKARVSPRQIQYMLKQSETSGELYIERNPGRNKTNRYFVVVGLDAKTIQRTLAKRFGMTPLEALAATERLLAAQIKGEADCTISDEPEPEKGEADFTIFAEKGAELAGKGEVQRQEKVKPTSPDSSVNPSNSDSSNIKTAEEAESRAREAENAAAASAALESVWAALLRAGVEPNWRTEKLARQPFCSAEYVDSWREYMAYQGKAGRISLLITNLESGIPAPPLPNRIFPDPTSEPLGEERAEILDEIDQADQYAPPPDPSVNLPLHDAGGITAWQAWITLQDQLKIQMSRRDYSNHLAGAWLLRYEPGDARAGGSTFVVAAGSPPDRDWLESNLASTACRMLAGICNRTVNVVFTTILDDQPIEV